MDFEPKPIGIDLKAKAKQILSSVAAKSALQKVPAEKAKDPTDEPAQLAVDVVETDNELLIIAPLAGIAPEAVRVEITEDVVTIQGEREYPLPEIEPEDKLVEECYFGPFARSIVLPESVDTRAAAAEFKKSVLVIRLPKLDNVRTRIIKVQPAEK